jgi:hypothetical protein
VQCGATEFERSAVHQRELRRLYVRQVFTGAAERVPGKFVR